MPVWTEGCEWINMQTWFLKYAYPYLFLLQIISSSHLIYFLLTNWHYYSNSHSANITASTCMISIHIKGTSKTPVTSYLTCFNITSTHKTQSTDQFLAHVTKFQNCPCFCFSMCLSALNLSMCDNLQVA